MNTTVSRGAVPRKRPRFFVKKNLTGYLFVTPLLLGLFVFHLYPVFRSFQMSLENTNGVAASTFVGLDNYLWILGDSLFWGSIYNTFYMTALSLILNVCISLVLASMINSAGRTRNLFKSVYFFPNVVSVVATSILFSFLFYPTKAGIVNALLKLFGMQPLQWFSSPQLSRLTICLMGAWRTVGYYIIIFLAGLQSVSRELYEAADVDGVNGFRKWWHITLPSIRPIIAFIVIMDTITSMRRFSDVYMVGGTGGNPGATLVTTVLYIYRHAFTGSQMGISSAAAVVLFFMILLLSILNNILVNRPNDR